MPLPARPEQFLENDGPTLAEKSKQFTPRAVIQMSESAASMTSAAVSQEANEQTALEDHQKDSECYAEGRD